MPIELQRYSRLRYATVYVASNGVRDIEWFDLPKLPRNVPAATDKVYAVDASDRIDSLAYRSYGDPIMWDVIAEINNLRELPQDLVPNSLIRLPSRTRVLTDIRGASV